MKPRHLFAVVGVNVIFAGAYIAGKFGVDHFPPLFFSGLRFLLLFVALSPFFRLSPAPREDLPVFFGFCLAMGVGVYSTMYLALAAADGVGGILIGTQFAVPMAALLSVWALGDKIDRMAWAGICLAFVGVMAVGYNDAILGRLPAFTLILASAFFYAFSNVLSRRLTGAVGLLTLNAWMALLAMPVMFAASWLLEDGQWQALTTADGGDWAAALYSSLAVSILGHVGMFALLRRYPVATVMPFYVLTPIFGVIGGIALLGERPTGQFYGGAMVALAGVWIVNSRGKRAGRLADS